MREVPVLIVGGGPVGLTAALECAYFGIPALLVERHASTTWHPKARNLNTRTMEIMRRLGLEAALQAVSLPEQWTRQIIYAQTLAGTELGRMDTAGFSGYGAALSPCAPALSSQDVFEPIWRARAEQSPLVELLFGAQAQVLDVGNNGAVVRIREQEGVQEIRARYLLVADGADSEIRLALGIEMQGRQNIGHFINVYYEANLDRLVAHRPAVLYFTSEPGGRGVFQPLDGEDRWLSQINYDGSVETRASFDAERCTQWIRAATGNPRQTAKILGVANWTMNATVASSYRKASAFLVGDSAHQLPPTGGFGLNTGIQDVHNLVWKLAYVLKDYADADLLDSYEAERKPVARFNADRALENSRAVADIQRAANVGEQGLSATDAVSESRRYGNFQGLELGFHYRSGAIIDDGSDAPAVVDAVENYQPCARPGHRMPHLSIGGELRGGVEVGRCSSLDLVGQRFLVMSDSHAWLEACAQHNLDCRIVREGRAFLELFGLASGGAVLVRPDGHVAARFEEQPDLPGGILAAALRNVLGEGG